MAGKTRTKKSSSKSPEVVVLPEIPDEYHNEPTADEVFGPRLTYSQAAHQRIQKNKQGYRGVSLGSSHSGKLFKARIRYKNRRKHIGCYATAKEAALAYDEWAKKVYGRFAVLNFPED